MILQLPFNTFFNGRGMRAPRGFSLGKLKLNRSLRLLVFEDPREVKKVIGSEVARLGPSKGTVQLN